MNNRFPKCGAREISPSTAANAILPHGLALEALSNTDLQELHAITADLEIATWSGDEAIIDAAQAGADAVVLQAIASDPIPVEAVSETEKSRGGVLHPVV